MLFYISQFCFLFVGLYSYSHCKNKYLAFCLKLLSFLIVFLPAAFRYNIGTDYKNYVEIFSNISNNIHDSTEFGWQLLNKICIFLNLQVQYLFIISSFITYYLIVKTVKRDTIIILLIYYIYLYSASYNIIRNCLGLSFVWYGYYLIVNNKTKQGLLCSIISGLFHSSCLLYIPIFLLSFWWTPKKKTVIVFFLVFFFLYRFVNIAELIFSLPILKSYRWSAYLFSDKLSAKTSIGLGVYIRHFFLLFIYLLCDEKKLSKKEFSILSWMFLGLSLADFLSCQIIIFYRVQIVMYLAYILMFKAIKMSNIGEINIYKYLGRYVCYLYVLIFVFYLSLVNQENGIIPYNHITFGDLL